MKTNNLTQIGTVFVDAGIVMVGDPCYTLPDDGSHRDQTTKVWSKFCEELSAQEYDGYHKPFFTPEVGIVVQSGYGDGEYPVFVEYSDEGRVKRLVVEFIPDEEEEFQW